MQEMNLNVFYWQKDENQYNKIIEQLKIEGWEVYHRAAYKNLKGEIIKHEVNFIRFFIK